MTIEPIVNDVEMQAAMDLHDENQLKLHFQNYTGVITVSLEVDNNRLTLTLDELQAIVVKTRQYERAVANLTATGPKVPELHRLADRVETDFHG